MRCVLVVLPALSLLRAHVTLHCAGRGGGPAERRPRPPSVFPFAAAAAATASSARSHGSRRSCWRRGLMHNTDHEPQSLASPLTLSKTRE